MNVNITIDDQLFEETRRAGQHSTREEALRCALEEYVLRRRRRGILDLYGTVGYENDYDYKAERQKDQS
jgi:hypothetical protein